MPYVMQKKIKHALDSLFALEYECLSKQDVSWKAMSFLLNFSDSNFYDLFP